MSVYKKVIDVFMRVTGMNFYIKAFVAGDSKGFLFGCMQTLAFLVIYSFGYVGFIVMMGIPVMHRLPTVMQLNLGMTGIAIVLVLPITAVYYMNTWICRKFYPQNSVHG